MRVVLRTAECGTAKGRAEIAGIVSRTVNAFDITGFPYKPNENDDYYWTVDVGNDWKVRFFADCPHDFEIIHRYDNREVVEGISRWFAYRLGGEVE